jgi:arylsulfatase A-like enzyme
MKYFFLLSYALFLLVAILFTHTAFSQPNPPNIIYILADDLGYRELGSYGQQKIKTPHLDQLAAEGMRFTQHYAGSAVCAPSRCTLLTGQHTGHAYVRNNYELGGFLDSEERGQMPLPEDAFTIGHMLQEQGYMTGAIGKWGLGGPGSTGIPNKQGFDFFYGYLDQKQAHNYYPTHLWRNETWDTLNNVYFSPHQKLEEVPKKLSEYDQFKGNEYAQDKMAAEALRFIREHQSQKFFLYLPFPVPHLALQVPDEALTAYRGAFPETPYLGEDGYLPHPTPKAAYAAMISRMDQQIGAVMALLKELGLDDNTLVLFSSDNGATFLEGPDTEYFESVGELRGLKGDLYEGGIRVPMIARWPGKIPAATVSEHVSAFWDVMPTLAELTSARIPHDSDGISFLPTLLGKQEQQTVHAFLYWEYHSRGSSQAIRMGDWKGIRTDIKNNPDAEIQLYKLDDDVGEQHNLADRHPEIVEQIQRLMHTRTPSHIEDWNFE